jgi:hypothetical protein
MDLKHVRKVVVHDNCMDGLASAMLIWEALPETELVFCGYGSQQEELEAEEGMLFCDFTPPRARVHEFVAKGAIVLDHHIHAKDIVAAFDQNGVFSDERGVSGAVLAYRHVYEKAHVWDGAGLMREFADLVGIRDTWVKDCVNWERALQLHAVLEAYPREHWLAPSGIRHAMGALNEGIGVQLRFRKQRTIAGILERGLIRRQVGFGASARTWGLTATDSALVSDLAEAARDAGVGVLVNVQSFVEDGALWFSVNLRSDGTLDVGALAKRFGGGGHKAAAGFRTRQDTPAHPLEFFADLATLATSF